MQITGCTTLSFSLESRECKSWVNGADGRKTLTSEEIVAKFPDVEQRYDYAVCINKYRHPPSVYPDIFLNDTDKAVPVLQSKLHLTSDVFEITFILLAFDKMMKKGAYNVTEDKSLTLAILEAKEKTKGTVWYSMADEIVQSIYKTSMK